MEKSTTSVKENSGRGELPLMKSVLSLEPALVLHMTSVIMVFMNLQNLLLEKACRVNLGFSDEVCDALNARQTEGLEKEEQQIQALMGQAIRWRTILENAFPIFLVFFVGAWSDKYGRKYPILAVIFAFVLQNFFLILILLAGNLTGIWTVTVISSLTIGISGGQACFISSAFSYTSDHTPVERRTVRTGFTHSLLFLGLTVGLAAGGIVAKIGMSFVKIFALGMTLETICLIYLIFSMENKPLPGTMDGKTAYQIFMELFNFGHIKEAGKCITKKREGNTRLKLWLLLVSHACSFMQMMGEQGVLYLFCRYQFNWDAGTFGTFMSYKMVVGFLGNFLSMGLLTGKLKFSDPQNGIVACVSNLITALLYAFSSSSIVMVFGPLISILGGAGMVVSRSMLSKLIPTDEQGKVNSCIGSMEAILPLVTSSLYTTVYTTFLSVFPGSFFLISAGLTIPPIIIFSWFLQQMDSKSEKKNE